MAMLWNRGPTSSYWTPGECTMIYILPKPSKTSKEAGEYVPDRMAWPIHEVAEVPQTRRWTAAGRSNRLRSGQTPLGRCLGPAGLCRRVYLRRAVVSLFDSRGHRIRCPSLRAPANELQ